VSDCERFWSARRELVIFYQGLQFHKHIFVAIKIKQIHETEDSITSELVPLILISLQIP
jgi:hypothetical protein